VRERVRDEREVDCQTGKERRGSFKVTGREKVERKKKRKRRRKKRKKSIHSFRKSNEIIMNGVVFDKTEEFKTIRQSDRRKKEKEIERIDGRTRLVS